MRATRRSNEPRLGPACTRASALVMRRHGFTLAEMVVVIAIVAIVAAIGLPRYGSSLARYRASMAAQRLAADLELARETARSRSDKVVVEFRPTSDVYILHGIEDANTRADDTTVDLSEKPYRADLVLVDVISSTVTFDGHGKPSHGGTFQLSAGGYQQTVTLDLATGKVETP